jgi:hypothetical protein
VFGGFDLVLGLVLFVSVLSFNGLAVVMARACGYFVGVVISRGFSQVVLLWSVMGGRLSWQDNGCLGPGCCLFRVSYA